MITLLFGESGVGKTYLGKRLSEKTGVPFVEGDDFLPEQLRKKVEAGQTLTIAEVDSYVVDDFIPAIKKLYKAGTNLIVSQALYMKRHRALFAAVFGSHNVRPVWVVVPLRQQIKQLWNRKKGLRWIFSTLISKPFFEKPTRPHMVKSPEDITSLHIALEMDKKNAEIM